MLTNILSSILAYTFTNEFPKRFQGKKEGAKGMLFDFALTLDYDKEEGYRHLDILVYAPSNYVGVWVRERWTVIDKAKLKAAKTHHDLEYDTNAFLWERRAYHDSCWREDGIGRTIWEYRDRLNVICSLGNYFKIIDVPEEIRNWKE